MTGRGTRSVAIAYGSGSLDIDVPADATVVLPRHRSPAADPLGALRAAINAPVAGPPLRELVRPGQRVAISVCDITRPQPRPLQLAALAEVLDGVIRDRGRRRPHRHRHPSGKHRARAARDARSDVLAQWRVVDHDARDEACLVDLGMVGDVPVSLNREWVAADLRITTGFVEPHFFAGFSGGPKMVAPGLAGLDTVSTLHNARRIGDPEPPGA